MHKNHFMTFNSLPFFISLLNLQILTNVLMTVLTVALMLDVSTLPGAIPAYVTLGTLEMALVAKV